MAKFNEYPVKTTPKDADKFMLRSNGRNTSIYS